jgi:hypothetical protein
MAHLIEDMRVLLQAAREIHAERHGAQTFTSGTYLPLEEAGRRSGLNPNREQKGRGVEQPRPSFLPYSRNDLEGKFSEVVVLSGKGSICLAVPTA